MRPSFMRNREKAERGPVPTVALTIPPLASVGLGEDQAAAAGIKFRKTFSPTEGWHASRRIFAYPTHASNVQDML